MDIKELQRQKYEIEQQLAAAAKEQELQRKQDYIRQLRDDYVGKAFDLSENSPNTMHGVYRKLVMVVGVTEDFKLETRTIFWTTKGTFWQQAGLTYAVRSNDEPFHRVRQIPVETFDLYYKATKKLVKDFDDIANSDHVLVGADLALREAKADRSYDIDFPHIVLTEAERAALKARNCPFRIKDIYLLTPNSTRWLTEVSAEDNYESLCKAHMSWASQPCKSNIEVYRQLQLKVARAWEDLKEGYARLSA